MMPHWRAASRTLTLSTCQEPLFSRALNLGWNASRNLERAVGSISIGAQAFLMASITSVMTTSMVGLAIMAAPFQFTTSDRTDHPIGGLARMANSVSSSVAVRG